MHVEPVAGVTLENDAANGCSL